MSYDVRERDAGPTHEVIMANLERNLEPKRVPQGSAVLRALLEAETYDVAVRYLEIVPMTSAGHFIVGGLTGNQGVVLSRTEDITEHKYELSDSEWYIAMTNRDVWETTVHDSRYENAM